MLEKKDLFTLANACCGVAAVLVLAAGYFYSVLFLALAAVMDLLDGKVARKTKPNEFGKQLDSLADAVSFGFAPSLVALSLANPLDALYLLNVFGALFFVCAGIVRLAKFNLQKQANAYYGVPIPTAGIGLVVFAPLFGQLLFFLFAGLALAMLAGFKVKKKVW